ncbi:hypothetical protein SBV1_270090 [Verrucomicrobia bacterium]|nr:hypothetical protein SBV1_270090 [Verrucomicrobiota bacterium]
MNEIETLEKYLDGITPPAYESDEHRVRLRRQVLGQLAANQPGRSPNRAWKVAALLAGLLCAGALAAQVAVQVHRYFFEGRTRNGSYQFTTSPQVVYSGTGAGTNGSQRTTVVHMSGVSVGSEELGAGGVEQMQKDLEEIDSLRAEDARELMSVTETEVDGYSGLGRVFQFKYVLSGGRIHLMNEGDPDSRDDVSPAQMEKDQEQIAKLRQQGRREIITVIETEVNGQISRTLVCQYALPDGRDVTIGEGDPSLGSSGPLLSSAQWEELHRLGHLKAGTFIGTIEKQLFGQSFTFQRYSYQLADGTVAISSEGQPTGPKRQLSEADRNELANLTKAGAGEILGNYEEEIRGKVFSFEQRLYLLSDGTEVIRSHGVPKTDH